jgi:hypothetical protein
LKSALERIEKLFRLTRRERHLLLYAWWLFLLVNPALRILPVTRLLPRGPATGATGPLLAADRIVWLVTVASRYAPGRTTCLKDALVLVWLLRREGVEALVRIGVARNARGLKAHAWLEHDGRVIFGSPDDETYEPLLSTVPTVRSS